MIARFQDTLSALIERGDRLLAAVSGGVDSMVMLDLLVKSVGIERLEVAHCNFGLRPHEADRETELVQYVCRNLGVTCHVAHFDTKEYCHEHGISTQEGARQLRYDFFGKLLVVRQLDKIVIAHNQGDTVETFFINMLRGSGLRGLRGILAMSGNVVRPLMFASRVEIEKYAADNGVKWLVDSSNNSDDYLRNNLRHNVLPALSKCRTGAIESILRTMERLAAHYDFEQSVIEGLRGELFVGDRMDIANFLNCKQASHFLLFSLLDAHGFSWDVSGDIFKSIISGEGQGKIFNGHRGRRALIDRGYLVVDNILPIVGQELVESDDVRVQISDRVHVTDLRSGAGVAYFDADKLTFPLILRVWSLGDRFVPFGMSGGSKKVSDLLVEKKVSRFDKEQVRVLVSGDEIVWVVGLRTDDRFKVDEGTRRIARIEIRDITSI